MSYFKIQFAIKISNYKTKCELSQDILSHFVNFLIKEGL
ncbi:hypothetical protein DSQ35_1483 [Campylobacter jejuni]|nr:hypothetical protein DSQ35_1483 [Campylobacter jejuni]